MSITRPMSARDMGSSRDVAGLVSTETTLNDIASAYLSMVRESASGCEVPMASSGCEVPWASVHHEMLFNHTFMWMTCHVC